MLLLHFVRLVLVPVQIVPIDYFFLVTFFEFFLKLFDL